MTPEEKAMLQIAANIINQLLASNPDLQISALNLEKSTETSPDYMPSDKGEHETMAKIKRAVTINGTKKWISAQSEQEYAEKVLQIAAGDPSATGGKDKHLFKLYATQWYEVYSKPNIATTCAITYERQLRVHIFPIIGDMYIEDVTTADIQQIYNNMSGARSTKEKVKTVLHMIFQSAIEDKIISDNPLKSRNLKISGANSKTTEPYSVEQMQYLAKHLDAIKKPSDKLFMALQLLHPLRLEEVLGLKWSDIDVKNGLIHVNRSVTHPDRNQPEIKETKTAGSNRIVGLSSVTAKYLIPGNPQEFVLGGKKPLSYSEVRTICRHVKADTGFSESITPIRFRTTVLTDLYEQTKDIKVVQAAAGHTTPNMTLKHYVKGRKTATETAAAIDNVYAS